MCAAEIPSGLETAPQSGASSPRAGTGFFIRSRFPFQFLRFVELFCEFRHRLLRVKPRLLNQAAELFSEGMTVREVAAILRISNNEAGRLLGAYNDCANYAQIDPTHRLGYIGGRSVAAWHVRFQLDGDESVHASISFPLAGPPTHHEAQQKALKILQVFLNDACEAAKKYHF